MNRINRCLLGISFVLIAGTLSAQSSASATSGNSPKDTLKVKKNVIVYTNKNDKSGKKKVRTYQITTADTTSKDAKISLKSKKIIISMASDSALSMKADTSNSKNILYIKTPHCFKFEFDDDGNGAFNGMEMMPCMPGMPGDFEIEEFEVPEQEEMPFNQMAFHFDPFMSDTALAMIMSFPGMKDMDTTFVNEEGDTIKIIKDMRFNMPIPLHPIKAPRNHFMWKGDGSPQPQVHNYYRPGTGSSISDLSKEEIDRLKKSDLKPAKSFSPMGLEELKARFSHFGDKLSLSFEYPYGEKLTVKLFDDNGKQFYHEEIVQSTGGYDRKIQLPEELGDKLYLRVSSGKQSIIKRIDR